MSLFISSFYGAELKESVGRIRVYFPFRSHQMIFTGVNGMGNLVGHTVCQHIQVQNERVNLNTSFNNDRKQLQTFDFDMKQQQRRECVVLKSSNKGWVVQKRCRPDAVRHVRCRRHTTIHQTVGIGAVIPTMCRAIGRKQVIAGDRALLVTVFQLPLSRISLN
ncbi:hypothetical protein X798_03497 [Onchocerca flexuosa]|uniref:Uncharacterized protein n=1 Tax=Onchocerca flexuosa TaxID=387005 RepID=A0A238BW38_9BILA|nr:hypothetical protein X798_03497 [Onchocerca flexuosa]